MDDGDRLHAAEVARAPAESVPGPSFEFRSAASAIQGVLAAAVAAVVAVQLFTFGAAIFFPYGLNYVEGFVLFDAARLGRFQNIYLDPAHEPYHLSVYTPLYALLTGFLGRWLGNPLAVGRAISFLSLIAVCAAVTDDLRRRHRWLVAGMAAGLLLSSSALHPWAALVKPDLLALLLAFAGLLAVERARGHAGLTAAAALFALAFWTRQSALAAPAAAILHLARVSRPRAAALACLTALLAGVPFLALCWGTDGLFWLHTVTANHNAWKLGRVGNFFGHFALRHVAYVALAAAAAAGALRRRSVPLPVLYLVASWLFALAVGKVGSDSNYMIEPLLATVWAAAREGGPVLVHRRHSVRIGLALVLTAQALSFLPRDVMHYRLARASRPDLEKASAMVAAIQGPILSDDAVLLALNGRPVVYHGFVMTQMAAAGRWDDAPVVDAIQRRAYAALVLQTDPRWVIGTRYTKGMFDAIAGRYTPVAQWTSMGFRYALLRPAPAAAPRDPE
jgi:hypothetical protein